MRPLVAHNLALGILFCITSAGPLIEVRVRARTAAKGRSSPEWTFFVIVPVVLSCFVIAVIVALNNVLPLPGGVWWPTITGILLMWVGLAVRIWSVLTLGHFFQLMVVIQDDHRVIDKGPYRFVRHPSYLGDLIYCLGLGLVASDWISFGVLLAGTTAVVLMRIKVEERTLVQALGSEYSRYMTRTACLVPGVY
jgi:protein-S-isoprenylcysteine O-methyltransferase Ste14